jgi:hypothetical protein
MTDLTPAEQNVVATIELGKSIQTSFLALGGLLKINHDNAYWSVTGYGTWKDYLEQLGIGSYSQAMRMIQVYEIVSARILSAEDVKEIGLTKTMLLLPLAAEGNLTEDLILLARNGTARELRQELGHKVPHNNPKHSVICSRCGYEVLGARWVKE